MEVLYSVNMNLVTRFYKHLKSVNSALFQTSVCLYCASCIFSRKGKVQNGKILNLTEQLYFDSCLGTCDETKLGQDLDAFNYR